VTSLCIYGKGMVTLDQATAATDAAAKRKRVVTSKPTKNGCKTCRFVYTSLSGTAHTSSNADTGQDVSNVTRHVRRV